MSGSTTHRGDHDRHSRPGLLPQYWEQDRILYLRNSDIQAFYNTTPGPQLGPYGPWNGYQFQPSQQWQSPDYRRAASTQQTAYYPTQGYPPPSQHINVVQSPQSLPVGAPSSGSHARCQECGRRKYELRSSPTVDDEGSTRNSDLSNSWNVDSQDSQQPTQRSSNIELHITPDFVVWNSSEFQPGRVFEAVWPEYNIGSGSESSGCEAELFGKVNIFIILERRYNHVKALCIHTYESHGAGRKQKSDHCIAYTGDTPPMPLQDEYEKGVLKLRPIPILIHRKAGARSLHPNSRINLGRVISIDHNTRVRDFGIVDSGSLDALQEQHGLVNSAWAKKRRDENKQTKNALKAWLVKKCWRSK